MGVIDANDLMGGATQLPVNALVGSRIKLETICCPLTVKISYLPDFSDHPAVFSDAANEQAAYLMRITSFPLIVNRLDAGGGQRECCR